MNRTKIEVHVRGNIKTLDLITLVQTLEKLPTDKFYWVVYDIKEMGRQSK